MHYVTAKGILSAKNGMNLYRGCSHGCIYCDSRSNCYHIEHDFEDIEVKENAIDLLENALKRKRKKCMIGTGSMTDPYIPLELEIGNVRKALSLIYEYGYGFTVITKSNRIMRDIDLLEKINKKTKCVVQMTLTTYADDPELFFLDKLVCGRAADVEYGCDLLHGVCPGLRQRLFLLAIHSNLHILCLVKLNKRV